MMLPSVAAAILVLTLGTPQSPAPTPAAAPDEATTQPAQAPTPTVDPDSIGVSLERIQKGVTKPQTIKLSENRQIYRVEIFGAKPSIEDILCPEFWRGPGAERRMTHPEC